MNDINQLIQIIQSLGGAATTDEIVNEYCREYHMVILPYYKRVVENTLSAFSNQIRKNKADNQWELKPDDSTEYLYVSDSRYYRTISDVMSKIFCVNSIQKRHGYFPVDNNYMAWFPKFDNDNWLNTFSDDGRFWHQKPRVGTIRTAPDNKLRFVFAYEKNGYRFTGLFKPNGFINDDTEEFELIDDKVEIRKPRPYLIVCRVAYMKQYNGITEDDIPVNGGSYVSRNNDAAEKMNFHRYDDGNCYIYVETGYKRGHTGDNSQANSVHLEQIDPNYRGKDFINGVKVALTASSPVLNKSVVVGWYDNVTIFRNRVVDSDKVYMMKCAYDDAHLIPESERVFEVPRSLDNDFGIGRSQFWYIQKFSSARNYEEELIEYLESKV